MRDLVCEERDPMLFRDLGVPRSTAASWIRRGPRPVVSAEALAMDQQELQAEILALQRRARFLLAIIRLAAAAAFRECRFCRRAEYRSATLPFALNEGPVERPGACWGPIRSGAAISLASSMA